MILVRFSVICGLLATVGCSQVTPELQVNKSSGPTTTIIPYDEDDITVGEIVPLNPATVESGEEILETRSDTAALTLQRNMAMQLTTQYCNDSTVKNFHINIVPMDAASVSFSVTDAANAFVVFGKVAKLEINPSAAATTSTSTCIVMASDNSSVDTVSVSTAMSTNKLLGVLVGNASTLNLKSNSMLDKLKINRVNVNAIGKGGKVDFSNPVIPCPLIPSKVYNQLADYLCNSPTVILED